MGYERFGWDYSQVLVMILGMLFVMKLKVEKTPGTLKGETMDATMSPRKHTSNTECVVHKKGHFSSK